MSAVLDVFGGIFLIIGSVFILLAGIGVVRFGDPLARMHAAAKAPTLGLISIAIGMGLMVRSSPAIITGVLVVALQLVTAPVGAHLLGRAAYRHEQPRFDAVDELAHDESVGEDGPSAG